MTAVQRLILAILPRSAARAAEEESKRWMLKCPCGHQRSIWDAGGIRWKAAGNPHRLMRCPKCGQRTVQRLEKRA